MMILGLDPGNVAGLPAPEKERLGKLLAVYASHASGNAQKSRYYEGKIPLGEVNLGIALPDGMSRLEVGCSWGTNAVDVLAARSMFDGYVAESGSEAERLARLVRDNRLLYEYKKACKDELKYGCTFATLAADRDIGCKIRFHSPATAAAVWPSRPT